MSAEVHRLPLGFTNCYLIKERSVILVDAGPPQKADLLRKKLQALSINPKDISLIVITHAARHLHARATRQSLSVCC